MQDYYEVLGVDRNATDDVIKRVYRQLVRAYHPDVMPDSEAGVARLKLINAAYETLKDPDKRRRYDLGLGIRPTAQSPRSGDRSSQGSKGAQAAEAERARHARQAEERARRDRAEQEQADRLRRAAEKEAERRREAARKAAEEAERRRDDAPRPAPHRPTAPPLDGAGRVVPKPRGQRRNAWLVAVAAVAVIAVLAVAGVIWATTRGGESKLNSGVAIGDPYQGGVLAYILQPRDPGYSSTAEHGLVAATADQSDGIVWALLANQGTSVAGAMGTAIGTGAANTDAIIAQNGVGTGYAADLARAYNGGGYTDWYLPSKNELDKLYLNRDAIGGFNTTWSLRYWSSSEYDASFAWCQLFGDGFQGGIDGKSGAFRVRAVRAF